jgi:hypothetical protein
MKLFKREKKVVDPIEEILRKNPDEVFVWTTLVGVYLSRFDQIIILYGLYSEWPIEAINDLIVQELHTLHV